MGIQQEKLPAGANKRRRPSREHDDDHQQGADADADADDLQKKTKKKQARGARVLVMEYTAEDVARFDEEMARADKLSSTTSRLGWPRSALLLPTSPWYRSPRRACGARSRRRVVVGEGGRRRVSKASIKIIRSFAGRSGYHPFSERLLSNPRIFARATADKVRISDRIMSKLFAQAQARARKILHHYDAKGYLEYTADGAIDLSTPPPAGH